MAPGKRNRGPPPVSRGLHDICTPCGRNAGRETRMKCSVPHVAHVLFCATPKCARLEARGK
eukprot:782312-Prymnesium_polylepis.1